MPARRGGEQTAGNLQGRWTGTAPEVVAKTRAKDGRIDVYLSADWEDVRLACPKFKGIVIHPCIAENLLQCSVIIVMRGAQCGPLHLDLVVHIKDWLFSITPPSKSLRDVEGFGMVDYVNILWCIDSGLGLYRTVCSTNGMYERSVLGAEWDGFWYIYRRGDATPSYSHIGIDTAASLNKQEHVAEMIVSAIEASAANAEAAGRRNRHTRKGSARPTPHGLQQMPSGRFTSSRRTSTSSSTSTAGPPRLNRGAGLLHDLTEEQSIAARTVYEEAVRTTQVAVEVRSSERDSATAEGACCVLQ